jgi:hypothetical protein
MALPTVSTALAAGAGNSNSGRALVRLPASASGFAMTTLAEATVWYRRNAAMCVEIAKRTSDAGEKLLLLDMAQAWADLAEELLKLESCERDRTKS